MSQEIILAQNLRHFRTQKSLTQEQFAEFCGISLRLYQKLEGQGGNPTLQTLTKIARALHTTADRLLRLDHLYPCIIRQTFLNLFHEHFATSAFAAGIRTTKGISVYANVEFERMMRGGLYQFTHPTNLLRILRGEAKETLENALIREINGLPTPYINYYERPDGKRIFMQYYPTLLHYPGEIEDKLVAMYVTNPDLRADDAYFSYAEELINITMTSGPK